MKILKLCAIGTITLSTISNAQANSVLISAPSSLNMTYRLASMKDNGNTAFGELRSIHINHSANIDCTPKDSEKSGIIIISVNGRILPDRVNQFNQPKQCSMTTDAAHPVGALDIAISEHAIKCTSSGGVFA